MLPAGQDVARRLLWKLTPRRVHSFGARCYEAIRVSSAEGVGTYRQLTRRERGSNELTAVRLREYSHPIYVRPGTTDAGVVIQNLIRKEYGRLPRNMTASFIIDAGANVGDTSLFFLRRFRNCRIIALEPHPVFFPIASRNLNPYSNVTLLRKGLWDCETALTFSDDSTGSSVCSGKPAATVIETTDVPSILEQYGADHIDILKMDIEGAERNVILNNNSDSWLQRTSMIIVELHGSQIRDDCTSYLKSKGFTSSRYRSLHYFVNESLRSPAWD